MIHQGYQESSGLVIWRQVQLTSFIELLYIEKGTGRKPSYYPIVLKIIAVRFAGPASTTQIVAFAYQTPKRHATRFLII